MNTPEGRDTAPEHVEVRDDSENRYYELLVDGAHAGLMVYERKGSRRLLTHTFIAEGFRGRGLVKQLVGRALDDIRDRGETITNHCEVVDHYIRHNPAYAGLIDARQPGSWRDHPRPSPADAGLARPPRSLP